MSNVTVRAKMSNYREMSPDRQRLLKRAREFCHLTRDEELRAQMWRLSQVVADRDCPQDIATRCNPLYGLIGDALKRKLTALLPLLESQVTRNQQSRDRIDAIMVSKSLLQQDALRDFYFEMSEADLQTIWDHDKNDLPASEKDLVRAALRNKKGIGSASAPPEICPRCFVPKQNCVCERGWW
jgi:hypothetical protein